MQKGECDLNQLSEILLNKNICEILVEAGGILNASLLKAKIVDELNIFIAPSLIIDNASKNLFNSIELEEIKNSIQLLLEETKIFDNDILLKYSLL
jgi:diaminohydroxyphosphoribosylaminopyrimidine deaminase/5-amino-6-(5-phosphoribosylamino)uracil reductase